MDFKSCYCFSDSGEPYEIVMKVRRLRKWQNHVVYHCITQRVILVNEQKTLLSLYSRL